MGFKFLFPKIVVVLSIWLSVCSSFQLMHLQKQSCMELYSKIKPTDMEGVFEFDGGKLPPEIAALFRGEGEDLIIGDGKIVAGEKRPKTSIFAKNVKKERLVSPGAVPQTPSKLAPQNGKQAAPTATAPQSRPVSAKSSTAAVKSITANQPQSKYPSIMEQIKQKGLLDLPEHLIPKYDEVIDDIDNDDYNDEEEKVVKPTVKAKTSKLATESKKPVKEDDEDDDYDGVADLEPRANLGFQSKPQAAKPASLPSISSPSTTIYNAASNSNSNSKPKDKPVKENKPVMREVIEKRSQLQRNRKENYFPNAASTQEFHRLVKQRGDDAVVEIAPRPTFPKYKADNDHSDNEDEYDDESHIDAYTKPTAVISDSSYRMRPIPTPDPEFLKQQAEKNRLVLEREEIARLKRQAKLDEGKTRFRPFSFLPADDESLKSSQTSLFADADVTFEQLGITDPVVLKNLMVKLKVTSPTKIQQLAIPMLQAQQSLILQAQTGSGKTLSYLLPLLSLVDPNKRSVQVIILAPSRELVLQITKVACTLFSGTNYRAMSIIGGANSKNQIRQLREDRPQVIVGTPGRLAEMVFKLEKLPLGNLRAIIIDEVDNLLDDLYIDELRTLIEATPLVRSNFGRRGNRSGKSGSNDMDEMLQKDIADNFDQEEEQEEQQQDAELQSKSSAPTTVKPRQDIVLCLASATATAGNDDVRAFADQYVLGRWTTAAVQSAAMLPTTVTHGLISTPQIKKLEYLRKFLFAQPAVERALIFVNDPHRVEIVAEKLLEMNLIAAPLHGDSSKDDRKEVIARITDGRLKFVVTTEIAARGLDIPDLTHVINFELPTDAPHYVHRVGRCGRAGRQGLVMNFATPETKFVIRRFGKKLGVKVMDCEIREGQVFLKEP